MKFITTMTKMNPENKFYGILVRKYKMFSLPFFDVVHSIKWSYVILKIRKNYKKQYL